MISPKIRRELALVRSMRTATSSQESASATSVSAVPPNQVTPKAVEEAEEVRGATVDGVFCEKGILVVVGVE